MKRKRTNVDEGVSYSKQSERKYFFHFRKYCHYSKEYLSVGFTCTSPEDKQLSQCMLCYEVVSNKAMKLSKLQRHLDTKHEERATKNIKKIFQIQGM